MYGVLVLAALYLTTYYSPSSCFIDVSITFIMSPKIEVFSCLTTNQHEPILIY